MTNFKAIDFLNVFSFIILLMAYSSFEVLNKNLQAGICFAIIIAMYLIEVRERKII